jgi:positive regulator of sigma E activity
MDQSTIYLSIFVALISMVAMIRIYGMRTGRIAVVSHQSQTMCPSCHSITARSKVNCLHCGKPLHGA